MRMTPRKLTRILVGVGALALSGFTISASALFSQGPAPELGDPGRTLTVAEMDQFVRGRKVFDRNFHRKDGLGTPDLNADSCRACHQDPIIGGSGGLDVNVFRYARDHFGAGPFQDLPGGQTASKLRSPWLEGREEHDPTISDVYEQRQTPPVFGLGMIDSIPASEILSNEDPTDADGDGIMGVARMLNVQGVLEPGRFGWKAQIPFSFDFIRDAMAGECGITTVPDGRGFGSIVDQDAVLDPELSAQDFDDIAFWLAELAPPQRGGSTDPAVVTGESVFNTIGCAKCHIPSMQGASAQVHLYSDLLLHNVMPPFFRGMAEPGADAGMYRTPPLWGIKHSAPYMHDGRGETLLDAILHHDSEALGVRQEFEALSQPEKDALILFLEDL
jgi:CxxC motif-containing protein (DUF1111 family)